MSETSVKNRNSTRTLRIYSSDDGENIANPWVLENRGIQLGERIGCGTHAIVKLATGQNGEKLAVKIIDKNRVSTEFLTKFLPREVDAMRSLHHPNIVNFRYHIVSKFRVYLVMDYAERGTLLNELQRKHQIEEGQARKWFIQLMSAVRHCHERGIVHRDIKCENLLLTQNWTLKLTDFGNARTDMRMSGHGVELSGTYCGSVGYMAPELLASVPYVPQYADVWAMGVVLFVMVYGQLPFTKDDNRRFAHKVQTKVQFPPDPRVSNMCRNFIKKMIAMLPSRAYFPELRRDPWVAAFLEKPRPSDTSFADIKLRESIVSHQTSKSTVKWSQHK